MEAGPRAGYQVSGCVGTWAPVPHVYPLPTRPPLSHLASSAPCLRALAPAGPSPAVPPTRSCALNYVRLCFSAPPASPQPQHPHPPHPQQQSRHGRPTPPPPRLLPPAVARECAAWLAIPLGLPLLCSTAEQLLREQAAAEPPQGLQQHHRQQGREGLQQQEAAAPPVAALLAALVVPGAEGEAAVWGLLGRLALAAVGLQQQEEAHQHQHQHQHRRTFGGGGSGADPALAAATLAAAETVLTRLAWEQEQAQELEQNTAGAALLSAGAVTEAAALAHRVTTAADAGAAVATGLVKLEGLLRAALQLPAPQPQQQQQAQQQKPGGQQAPQQQPLQPAQHRARDAALRAIEAHLPTSTSPAVLELYGRLLREAAAAASAASTAAAAVAAAAARTAGAASAPGGGGAGGGGASGRRGGGGGAAPDSDGAGGAG